MSFVKHREQIVYVLRLWCGFILERVQLGVICKDIKIIQHVATSTAIVSGLIQWGMPLTFSEFKVSNPSNKSLPEPEPELETFEFGILAAEPFLELEPDLPNKSKPFHCDVEGVLLPDCEENEDVDCNFCLSSSDKLEFVCAVLGFREDSNKEAN
ncbi:hypothetical protein WICPIJ_007578 [Wickerhamomyces pijperi]|uniref:Uncharacterized protein n=1 Tax=Wickerhamomyces pijperi TaxID=599730 RepID=A0A9P8TJV0_WICPI|nr:hypothetical protein WICPIJ_007578 [Wickerhamomyces pijperi]